MTFRRAKAGNDTRRARDAAPARNAPPAISATEAADALQRHMGATGVVVASAARARRFGRPT